MKRVVRAIELMHLLPQLRVPQSELLLLCSCMGIVKLFFGLRICQPNHMEKKNIWLIKSCKRRLKTSWLVEVLF